VVLRPVCHPFPPTGDAKSPDGDAGFEALYDVVDTLLFNNDPSKGTEKRIFL